MVENLGKYKLENLLKYEKEYFDYVKEVKHVDLTYYGNWQRDLAKLIFDIAEINLTKKWKSMLDVGCACGINIRAYDELGIFKTIYGSDISNYMINEIIPKLYTQHKWNARSVEFTNTTAWDQYFIGDETIDLITCTDVLEHIPDKEKLSKTLKEFKRILNPSGKIIILVPAKTKTFDPSKVSLHTISESPAWWSRTFSKHFKSESVQARKIFQNTTLKPNRKDTKTFYEAYNKAWNIFRLVK